MILFFVHHPMHVSVSTVLPMPSPTCFFYEFSSSSQEQTPLLLPQHPKIMLGELTLDTIVLGSPHGSSFQDKAIMEGEPNNFD